MKSFFLLLSVFICLQVEVHAQDVLKKALQFEQEKDYKTALELTDSYFQTHPNPTAEIWLQRYRLAHRVAYDELSEKNNSYKNTYRSALHYLQQADKKLFQNTSTQEFIRQEIDARYAQWIQMGSDAFNTNQFQTALFWFDLCNELKPKQKEPLELIIYTYVELKNWKVVLDKIKQLIENQMASFEIVSLGLDVCRENQSFDMGLAWAEQLESSSDSTYRRKLEAYHSAAAVFYTQSNQWRNAQFHYQKMIDLTDDESFKLALVRLYIQEKKWDEANYHLNTITVTEITKPDVLNYYADTMFLLYNQSQKTLPLISSLRINPKLEWMRPYIAASWSFEKKNFFQAAKQVQATIDQNVKYKPALYLKAQSLYQLSISEKDTLKMDALLIQSIPFYEMAYNLDKSDIQLKEILRILYESTGQDQKLKKLDSH